MLTTSAVPRSQLRNFRNLRKPCSLSSGMTLSQTSKEWEMADVVVVGSGLAGLSATITLLKDNVNVVVLEAQAGLGGNSCKASSGMNSLTAEAQDSIPDFVHDIISSGGGLCDHELVDVLVQDSQEALQFIQDLGVDMSKVSQLGGHSHARTHRNPSGPNVGFAIMKPLMDYVQSHGAARVLTSCRLVDLHTDAECYIASYACGPNAEDQVLHHIRCKSVILATGGFAGSPEALAHAAPGLHGLPTTNKATADAGVVMRIAEKAGAQLVQIDQVQVHPTTFVDQNDPSAHSKVLAPEALRGHGAILVDANGQRFVNELATRDVVTAAVNSASKPMWMIMPQAGAEAFGMPAMGFYCSKGLMQKVSSVADLEILTSTNADALQDTITAYNNYCTTQASGQDKFGKKNFPAAIYVGSGHDVYVAQVTPAVHYCMGGVKFTKDGEVVGQDGDIMPGMYAAGEVTGGLHGRNRLAGSSLLDCVVFGRRAGMSAARHAKTLGT